MVKSVSMAVREFALPAPRSGSIEAHSGFGAAPRHGVEIHVELQAARVAAHRNYKPEVTLTHAFEVDGWRFKVSGRVDGFYDGALPVVEEIKSAFDADDLCQKLASRPDHPYLLQLKTYAYIQYKNPNVA